MTDRVSSASGWNGQVALPPARPPWRPRFDTGAGHSPLTRFEVMREGCCLFEDTPGLFDRYRAFDVGLVGRLSVADGADGPLV